MKIRLRHVLSLILVFTVILSVAAGCSKTNKPSDSSNTNTNETPDAVTDNNNEEPDKEPELYVIKVLTGPTNIKTSDETEVGKYIKENFGIVFENVPYTGDLREKQSLMLAGGDYGEIQGMQREDMVMNYINAGVLLDLDQYLDKMPDFKERFKEQIPYWRLPGQGKLYKYETWVPRMLNSDMEVNDMAVRTDALEKQGWPNPVSVDNWIAFLKQAVEDFPEVNGMPVTGLTVPFAESWGLAGVAPIIYEKSDKYSPVSNEGFTYNIQTDKFEDYFKNPYVKESYQFFNKLYQEGLLDEECFTDTIDKTKEKLSQGRSIAAFYNIYGSKPNAELAKNGNEKMQYINLPIQSNTSVANGEKRAIRTETTRSYSSVGLTNNCKHPERVIELINWACTDEGQIILRSGLEGVHWNRVDGKRVPTEAFIKTKQDPEFNSTQGLGSFSLLPSFNMLAADGQPHDLSADIAFIDTYSLTDRQKEAYQKLGWKSSKSWYADNGFFFQTGLSGAIYIEPSSELGKVHQKMTEFRVKASAKLILAESDEEFEKIYTDAMAEYEKLNPSSVIDEFNKLYNEKKATLEQYKNMN